MKGNEKGDKGKGMELRRKCGDRVRKRLMKGDGRVEEEKMRAGWWKGEGKARRRLR